MCFCFLDEELRKVYIYIYFFLTECVSWTKFGVVGFYIIALDDRGVRMTGGWRISVWENEGICSRYFCLIRQQKQFFFVFILFFLIFFLFV